MKYLIIVHFLTAFLMITSNKVYSADKTKSESLVNKPVQ